MYLNLIALLHISSYSGAMDSRPLILYVHRRMVVRDSFTYRRWHMLILCIAFFTSSSPDFVTGRGRIISAHSQVDALGQAQSIGQLFLSAYDFKVFV